MLIKSIYILVVGGAGYIGSHMVCVLKDKGYIPVVLDKQNKSDLELFRNIDFFVGDMSDRDLLAEIFSKYAFHAVMHFAAYINVTESVLLPLKYYENNVSNTLILLDEMLKANVKHIIFSSSAAVYGNPESDYISETHTLSPINPYGRTKKIIEDMLQDLHVSHDLQFMILRYFNAAGAHASGEIGECHQPETHLIPLAIRAAFDHKHPITIYGDDYQTFDGSCIRDYVHVTDIANAHCLALEALLNGAKSNIYNIGSGHGYSIWQVLSAIQTITAKEVAYTISRPRAGDPAILVADVNRVQQNLRFFTSYSELAMILQDAIRFHQNKLACAEKKS